MKQAYENHRYFKTLLHTQNVDK